MTLFFKKAEALVIYGPPKKLLCVGTEREMYKFIKERGEYTGQKIENRYRYYLFLVVYSKQPKLLGLVISI